MLLTQNQALRLLRGHGGTQDTHASRDVERSFLLTAVAVDRCKQAFCTSTAAQLPLWMAPTAKSIAASPSLPATSIAATASDLHTRRVTMTSTEWFTVEILVVLERQACSGAHNNDIAMLASEMKGQQIAQCIHQQRSCNKIQYPF